VRGSSGEPQSEVVAIGGCTGVKVSVHSQSDRGVAQSMLVYVVADGRTSFNIGLRMEDSFLEATMPIFETAVASLKLTALQR